MITSQVVHICIFLSGLLISTSLGDNMLGPGLWSVLSVSQCEQEHPVHIDVTRRKVNRTHDGFNVKLEYDQDIDETYAVRIEICKHVDGGCKPYQTLADESLMRFVQKYAEGNTRDFLGSAGIDPPDFPVPAGSYEVNNYVFDYSELPPEAVYGAFGVAAFVARAGRDCACLRLDVEFKETDDDER